MYGRNIRGIERGRLNNFRSGQKCCASDGAVNDVNRGIFFLSPLKVEANGPLNPRTNV